MRTLCKTNITKAERLIFMGDLKAAQAAVAEAVTSLDKAAEKGVIHRNNAARRKSRLLKKLNQLEALAPTPVAAKPKAAEAEAEVKTEAEAKPKAKAKAKATKAAKPKAKATKAKPKATKAEPEKAKKTKKAKKETPEKLDAEG